MASLLTVRLTPMQQFALLHPCPCSCNLAGSYVGLGFLYLDKLMPCRYVVRDRANWCFEPASRWVLPLVWGVFIAALGLVLWATLYIRRRIRMLPWRMHAPMLLGLSASGSGTYGGGIGGRLVLRSHR